MAWNDLTIAQRSQLMNKFRHLGITDLTQMRQTYDAMSPLSSLGGTNDIRISPAPMYRKGGKLFYQGGGEETTQPEYRIYNDAAISLEEYKELQRKAIIDAAVKKALTRDRGVAPIINGQPDSSCLYTVTDNFGKKYRTAGNQAFAANPEKYGFKVNGAKGEVGDIYQMGSSAAGKYMPYHATLITSISESGEPLISYSRGQADRATAPLSEKEFNNIVLDARLSNKEIPKGFEGSYKDYLAFVKKQDDYANRSDYLKNQPVWNTPMYETYKFIGTPDDNAAWEEQYNVLPNAPSKVDSVKVNPYINNMVEVPQQGIMAKGGSIHIKPENRGKFTALKKRTGHSATWFKEHGTPAQKKMAVFALNSRKWKHSHGGFNF